jgi:leucyl aminopeptidase
VSYAIDNAALVTPMLAQVQESHILATIQTLSDFTNRYYTTSHGVAASDALFNTWKAMAAGRSDITVKQFSHGAWPMKSVILRIKGRSAAKQTVVLGAHLDSIVFGGVGEATRAPGADDDASGIASLTEALRVMLANGYQPERSIEFMAYAAEEVGLRGSSEIAARYQSQGRKVVGVMQLDMTNYKGSAEDIFIYTDYTSAKQNDFLAKLAKAYLPELKVGYDSCGYACSDHASWSNRGFVASFPFEASFRSYDPYIHSANDTLANTGNQAAHAAKFSRLALAYAVELGSDGPATKAR